MYILAKVDTFICGFVRFSNFLISSLFLLSIKRSGWFELWMVVAMSVVGKIATELV